MLASNFENISFYTHISNEDDEKGVFKENWSNIRKDLDGKSLPKIFIHRLHGCIAWFNNPDKNGGPSDTSEKLGAGGEDALYITDVELHDMCIKLTESQLMGTNRVFSSAFKEFRQQLRNVNTLLVWGYSFRDLEVTRLINTALFERAENPFKIYYIDPYLTTYAAGQHIRKTLSQVPDQVAGSFNPRKIAWIPEDGIEALTKIIIKIAKEANDAKR